MTRTEVVGRSAVASSPRIEAPEKVTGGARYSFEHSPDHLAYAVGVPATIAKGIVTAVETESASALAGVIAVLTPFDAPRLAKVEDPELALFQSTAVAYRGQWIAGVVADSLEIAEDAASRVRVSYAAAEHDVVLRRDHPAMYAPPFVNPRFETDSIVGDLDTAMATADVQIDRTYTTPPLQNMPMEPQATLAEWDGDDVTIYDSNQGVGRVKPAVAAIFGIEPESVRIIAEHVGGGFGSKGTPRANLVLAIMAARLIARPVKCAVTRQQMFSIVGHRTPTIQRVRLGADSDGRITAIGHDVWEQSSTLTEFAEQTAVATRHMYGGANRRTTHRLVRLDVPSPWWMRAPGECPGMFALESAMDELAEACAIDPIDLRIRNEPSVDPESGQPFSSRNVVTCLREARRCSVGRIGR